MNSFFFNWFFYIYMHCKIHRYLIIYIPRSFIWKGRPGPFDYKSNSRLGHYKCKLKGLPSDYKYWVVKKRLWGSLQIFPKTRPLRYFGFWLRENPKIGPAEYWDLTCWILGLKLPFIGEGSFGPSVLIAEILESEMLLLQFKGPPRYLTSMAKLNMKSQPIQPMYANWPS